VREVVDRAAARIGDRFTNQPLVEADIRATLGNIYGYQNKFDSAEIQLQRAFELFTKLLGPDHKDTLNALNLLVQTKTLQGKFGEAEPLAHRFVEACRRTQGPDSEATLNSLYVLAMCYSVQGRVGESLPLFQELLERRRRVSGLESNDTIEAMGGLAEDYAMLGRSLDAVQLYEEIVRICRGRSDLQYGLAGNLASLGNSYLRAGDLLEGVGIMKEAVEVDRRVWGPQDPRTLRDMLTLNTGYGATGSWESCIVLCREAVQSTNDLGLWLNLTYRGAVAAVLVGDTNAFRDFAGRLLSQFAGTTNADWARMTAEICLLTPDAVPDMQPVFRLAELGLSDEPAYPLGRPLARGMAEYRRGHLDEALRWFEAPRRAAHGPQPSQASYFCAMIHQRLGDGASARADLDQAAQQLAAYVRFGLSESWDGYGRIATVRAEAERLILGRTVSPPLDAAWLESARKQWEPVRRHLAQVECLVHQRKWAEARDEYVAAMREPVFDWGSADLEFPQKIGISFLLAGDRQNFEQFCREWFSRLEKNPEPGDAYSLVRTCLAGEPDVTTDLGQLALKWSDKVPLAWGAPGVVSWVRAMIAYRSGQYEDTIKHAKVAETSTQLGMRNAARLFHAMALAKSGRQEEGKKELAQAEVQLHGPLTSMTGDAHWEDLGLCQLALDEAHRLFGTSPTK
jgi:tetratricopeptide (TPR) repeat protein